jgi:hypothetical protein
VVVDVVVVDCSGMVVVDWGNVVWGTEEVVVDIGISIVVVDSGKVVDVVVVEVVVVEVVVVVEDVVVVSGIVVVVEDVVVVSARPFHKDKLLIVR